MNSKLYIIGTPIGNRGDITLRAIETLKGVKFFYVEDSREFAKLLELYGISRSGKIFHSYALHNLKEATERALSTLRAGQDVGLVADRGMPCISDPGSLLIEGAREGGFQIVPIPGPSSLITAMAASGFRADRFLFLGFFPQEQKTKGLWFESVKKLGVAVCLFESPKRVRATVRELAEAFPQGEIFFGREMTKMFETFQRVALSHWAELDLVEKGEYVLVLHPGEPRSTQDSAWAHELELRLLSEKVWAKSIAERYGTSPKTVYNALQDKKRKRGVSRRES